MGFGHVVHVVEDLEGKMQKVYEDTQPSEEVLEFEISGLTVKIHFVHGLGNKFSANFEIHDKLNQNEIVGAGSKYFGEDFKPTDFMTDSTRHGWRGGLNLGYHANIDNPREKIEQTITNYLRMFIQNQLK